MILAARRANVRRGVHILRHTFCSHLSMRGAPPKAIQELAGHADLTMTQRYMHLSPAALDAAIGLLEQTAGRLQPDSTRRTGRVGRPKTTDFVQKFGDVVETGPTAQKRSMNPGG